jgi:hypothetical protein
MYLDAENQSVVRLDSVDGKFVLTLNGNSLPLDLREDGRFATPGAPAVVEFDPKQAFLSISVLGAPSARYRLISNAVAEGKDLSQWVGRYFSAELKASWTVSVAKGALVVNGRAVDEFALQPVLGDIYATDSALFSFSRNAQGDVDGFEFTQSRTRRIRFDKNPKESCRG